MKIDILSDLHGYYPNLCGGDLLIIAGDCTANDKIFEWAKFFDWLTDQKYEKKILVAGNHDGLLEEMYTKTKQQADEMKEVQEFLIEYGEMDELDFEYLCDSGTEFRDYKIWGSPWTNWFHGVHPKAKSFMIKEKQIKNKFKKIPDDVDILITHSPPYGILDSNYENNPCGSLSLRHEIDTRLNPKIHCFGHIHEQGCKELYLKEKKQILFLNASYVDEIYKPRNNWITLHL